MAKKKAGEQNYKFTNKVTEIEVMVPTEKKDQNGKIIYEPKVGKAVFPFGPQCQPIFEDELTDSMAEFMLSRPDLDKLVCKK